MRIVHLAICYCRSTHIPGRIAWDFILILILWSMYNMRHLIEIMHAVKFIEKAFSLLIQAVWLAIAVHFSFRKFDIV